MDSNGFNVDEAIANINKKHNSEINGIKEEPIDYNRGRIKTSTINNNVRNFKSAGEKVKKSQKKYSPEQRILKLLIQVGIGILVGTALISAIDRSDREIEYSTGSPIEDTSKLH